MFPLNKSKFNNFQLLDTSYLAKYQIIKSSITFMFIDLITDFDTYLILAYSELPAFLTPDGGLNSGFMIAHCTAAALGE